MHAIYTTHIGIGIAYRFGYDFSPCKSTIFGLDQHTYRLINVFGIRVAMTR